MDLRTSTAEALVMTALECAQTLRLDQLADRLPELSWS